MKSLTTKILAGVLSLLLFTTIGSQIFYLINDKHDTEKAVLFNINEDIAFDGIVIRDEEVIEYNGDGVLDYQYEDGSKISVGSTIANVYSDENDIIEQKRIVKLSDEISILNRAQNPGTINYVQPDTLQTKIENEYKQILSCTLKNDYSSLRDAKNNLSVVINIYDIMTGSSKNFEDQISSLEDQIESLKLTSQTIDSIKAEKTGYFISYADGYENVLTTENAVNMDEDDISKIINNDIKIEKNVVGKIFDDYSCKIVGILTKDKRIVEGETLNMMLSASNQIYKVEVDSVKQAEDNDKVIVVFTCDRLDKALVNSRVQAAKIIFDEYQGLKVPRKAIRFQGEDKGVYVILGQKITFKKIDVIYENEKDDFVISKNTSEEDYLLLYDQILLEEVTEKDVSSTDKSS